mmetsp:Transcript_16695/g.28658  ORF Transcript_16695/g.28658 Transcript_16695/m.28658 type:complete len:291 (+) Transcript_16695:301-1173(+)
MCPTINTPLAPNSCHTTTSTPALAGGLHTACDPRNETTLDSAHGARRTALLATQMHEALCAVLVEQCVHAFAAAAQHVLSNVAPQHRLERLWQEASLDHQSLLSVQRPAGTQLCQQVHAHMLLLPVHGLAQVHEVGEHCLFGAFTRNLWWLQHCTAALSGELRVALLENVKHTREQLVILVVAVSAAPRLAAHLPAQAATACCPVFTFRVHTPTAGALAIACCSSHVLIKTTLLAHLLLLFLLFGQIQIKLWLAICWCCCGSLIALCRGGSILSGIHCLLGLLLLLLAKF